MTDPNWLPARVRRNFRIDLFSGICAGAFVTVLVAFMPDDMPRADGVSIDPVVLAFSVAVGTEQLGCAGFSA